MNQKRPNILFVMVDQLSALSLSCYGNKVVKAPYIDQIANEGIVFEKSHCNFPLCAPSRASVLTGTLCSSNKVYDNGAEFKASIPTFIHYLRRMGYHTSLSGKMHFVGPDQFHGFEERLVSELYPADFGWSPNWESDVEVIADSDGIINSGPVNRNMQMDHDEEVVNTAIQKLFDIAREPEKSPFCLAVSFTHPHDPFQITPEYWDRYDHDEIDMPTVSSIPNDKLDVHTRGLRKSYKMDDIAGNEELIRKARHAYYGQISYIDDKIGQLLDTLNKTRFRENTIVIFTSDHGEMLGERGHWFKKVFWERSQRVPLIISAPGMIKPKRVKQNVSLVDLFPTIVEFGGGNSDEIVGEIDGNSLCGLIEGNDDAWPNIVYSEVLSEGVRTPHVMVLEGNFKYMYGEDDKPLLFDLKTDPHELENLSGCKNYNDVEAELRSKLQNKWDLKVLKQQIIESQKQRMIINDAHQVGEKVNWETVTKKNPAKEYVRAGTRPYHLIMEATKISV